MDKVYKPGECIKCMNIEMHPALLAAWYCADVHREAAACGARVVPAPDLYAPELVLWSRSKPCLLGSTQGQVQLTAAKEPCDRALYVSCADEVAVHVGARALSGHMAQLKEMVGCTVTLVVFGAKDYFRSSRRKTENSRKLMTEIDLEMAKTDLLVSTNCDTVVVNTPNELALLIMQFTKALAEAPYKKAKRACDEEAEFYMKGDNKKCVAVDKDGNGICNLWQQMVAILPMSSLETSRALCAEYKTPRALYQKLQNSNSVNEIADIGVARAAVPGARARRVGPEFARRLHTFFTAEDGNVLLH